MHANAATIFRAWRTSAAPLDDLLDVVGLEVAAYHAERQAELTTSDDRAWHAERAREHLLDAANPMALERLLLDVLAQRCARVVAPVRSAPAADALALWRRELRAGRRSPSTFDALWRAAAWHAAARDSLPGTDAERTAVACCDEALDAWAVSRRRMAA